MSISPISKEDYESWCSLFCGYLEFYKTRLEHSVIDDSFKRIVSEESSIHGFTIRAPKSRVSKATESVSESSTVEQVREGDGKEEESREGGKEEICGIVHYIYHPTTWSSRSVCYLQDLFVAKSERRKGYARSLIEAVVKEAKREGCSKVYWTTQEGNKGARVLYDEMARHDGFIRYDLMLDR